MMPCVAEATTLRPLLMLRRKGLAVLLSADVEAAPADCSLAGQVDRP
jgi:hypothetical protein